MPHSRRFHFTILVLLSAVLACAVPGMPADVDTVSTAAAETVVAGLTQDAGQAAPPTTEPTLTLTFTPTLIRPTQRPSTETLTPLPVFTSISATLPAISETPTFIPEIVLISVSRPTNCRIGPGKLYEIAGTLLVGEKAEVLGRDPSGQYWYIPNPDPGAEFCWVWGEYATLEGSLSFVPLFTPPPTFTATATTVPVLDFKMKSAGLESCEGIWWLKIEISNFSEYPFKSMKIEMTDLDKNITRFTSSNGFASRKGCGPYDVSDVIAPEGVFVINGPKFDYTLNDHGLRGFITMCTQTELKGICTTRQGSFRP